MTRQEAREARERNKRNRVARNKINRTYKGHMALLESIKRSDSYQSQIRVRRWLEGVGEI